MKNFLNDYGIVIVAIILFFIGVYLIYIGFDIIGAVFCTLGVGFMLVLSVVKWFIDSIIK